MQPLVRKCGLAGVKMTYGEGSAHVQMAAMPQEQLAAPSLRR